MAFRLSGRWNGVFTLAGLLIGVFGAVFCLWCLLGFLLLPLAHTRDAFDIWKAHGDIRVSLALPLAFSVRNLVWISALLVWGCQQI